MPTPEANYADTLMRAACNFGSTQELASRLGISHDQLRKWMRGEEVPPTQILRRVADLIEKHDKPGH
jgi:transcriptional regulator with XRE-family HTH domain